MVMFKWKIMIIHWVFGYPIFRETLFEILCQVLTSHAKALTVHQPLRFGVQHAILGDFLYRLSPWAFWWSCWSFGLNILNHGIIPPKSQKFLWQGVNPSYTGVDIRIHQPQLFCCSPGLTTTENPPKLRSEPSSMGMGSESSRCTSPSGRWCAPAKGTCKIDITCTHLLGEARPLTYRRCWGNVIAIHEMHLLRYGKNSNPSQPTFHLPAHPQVIVGRAHSVEMRRIRRRFTGAPSSFLRGNL